MCTPIIDVLASKHTHPLLSRMLSLSSLSVTHTHMYKLRLLLSLLVHVCTQITAALTSAYKDGFNRHIGLRCEAAPDGRTLLKEVRLCLAKGDFSRYNCRCGTRAHARSRAQRAWCCAWVSACLGRP